MGGDGTLMGFPREAQEVSISSARSDRACLYDGIYFLHGISRSLACLGAFRVYPLLGIGADLHTLLSAFCGLLVGLYLGPDRLLLGAASTEQD
jgi:hypothetical protein